MTPVRTTPRLAYHRFRPVSVVPAAPTDEIDEAGRALSCLARSVLDRSSRVLRGVRSASLTPVCKRNYVDRTSVEDRAWRLQRGTTEAFCTLDAAQERALLTLIVGGAPAGRLSEIERRIVGEAISQLFESSILGAQLCEELRSRPRSPSWYSAVELRGTDDVSAVLSLYAPCRVTPQRISRPCLDGVSISLRATLMPHVYELGRIAAWDQGSVVRLYRGQSIGDVSLYAGARQLARGQLGSLYGERAVLITQILFGTA